MGLKSRLKSILEASPFLFVCSLPLRRLYTWLRYTIWPDRWIIRRKFKHLVGYTPDLDHPKSFQEKLQWLKLHDRNPLYHQCADKLRVRQFVTRVTGTSKYLTPLFFITEDWREVCPENFPRNLPFVLKCNHGNGNVHLVGNPAEADWPALRFAMRSEMAFRNGLWNSNREWCYKGIRPRIMAEGLIQTPEGTVEEYKYYFCCGHLVVIQYGQADMQLTRRFRYLAPDYTLYPTSYMLGGDEEYVDSVKLPVNSQEMLELATRLAQEFPYHVRIDLLSNGHECFINEITFFTLAGYIDVLEPASLAEELARNLVLPTDREC